MSRRARTRAPALAAKELSFLPAFDDTEPLDDDEHDGYSPIRERAPIPMRDGGDDSKIQTERRDAP